MILKRRKYFITFDWYLFAIILMLSIISILTILSATRPVISDVQSKFYIKQLIWSIVGVVSLFFATTFDYIWFKRFAYPAYLSGIILLILVYIIGKSGMGAQRWLSLGIFTFQPSEFLKVALILAISKYLSGYKENLTKFSLLLSLIIFGLLPFFLLIKQPDLGTGVVLFLLFIMLTLSKGINKRIAIAILVISLILIPILGKNIWQSLKEYQKERIVAFIVPGAKVKGISYQIEQSKITIGSGKLLGKGFFRGTQGPLRFLPEKHTDFIFSVFAEEWGFIGCTVVFLLYLLLFLRGIDTAVKAKDSFGKYLALGITFMFFIYFLINIGMVIGIMPVVGKPLPFMSYGGTAYVSNCLSAWILINIRMRRLGLFY